jgi:hypothetical protein
LDVPRRIARERIPAIESERLQERGMTADLKRSYADPGKDFGQMPKLHALDLFVDRWNSDDPT